MILFVRQPAEASMATATPLPVESSCTARAALNGHHIVFRSRGGSDEEENGTGPCTPCHIPGIHGSPPTIRVYGRAPYHLTWEIGCRPGHPPLLRFVNGVKVLGPPQLPVCLASMVVAQPPATHAATHGGAA